MPYTRRPDTFPPLCSLGRPLRLVMKRECLVWRRKGDPFACKIPLTGAIEVLLKKVRIAHQWRPLTLSISLTAGFACRQNRLRGRAPKAQRPVGLASGLRPSEE